MSNGTIVFFIDKVILSNNTDTHVSTDWQISNTNDFSNVIHESLNDTNNLLTYVYSYTGAERLYARVRCNTNTVPTDWIIVDEIKYFLQTVIKSPNILFPGDINLQATVINIKTEPFTLLEGYDTHQSTDWIITDTVEDKVIFESLNDTVNLISIIIPEGYLKINNTYNVKVIHNGFINSSFNTLDFATNNLINNIWYEKPNAHGYFFNTRGNSYPYKDKIFLANGYSASVVNDKIIRYDPVTDTYEELTQLPYYSQYASMFIADDIVYLGGGRRYGSYPYFSILCYDINKDIVYPLPTLPVDEEDFKVAVSDGVIYAFGVYRNNNQFTYAYDKNTETWLPKTQIPYTLLTAVSDAAVLSDGRILIAGSYYATSMRVYIYDPAADTWTDITPSGSTVFFNGIFPLKNNKALFYSSDEKRLKLYNANTDTWTEKTISLHSLSEAASCIVGERFLYSIARRSTSSNSRECQLYVLDDDMVD